MKTIILAGGYATRLQPITFDRPKPLLPVAGKPIIDYILASGPFPGRPIISTNRRFVRRFESWRGQSGWDVKLVVEETTREEEKLGTVGAIAFLVEKLEIDEDILVVAGDNIFEFSIEELLSVYQGRPVIALFDLKDPDMVRGRYGVIIVKDGKIVDFQEKPQQPKSTLASTACYIYPKQVLPLFNEFFNKSQAGKDAPGYFNEWLLKEKGWEIDPFIFETGWHDIGDRTSYIKAHQYYGNCETWQGQNVIVEDSKISNSVIFENSRIHGASISGCVVDRDCDLQGVTLKNCLVGRGVRIRRTP